MNKTFGGWYLYSQIRGSARSVDEPLLYIESGEGLRFIQVLGCWQGRYLLTSMNV